MHNKKIDLYWLRCLTNLHAGSGEITYGVIDKPVQRDTITKRPTIHGSGLKGAFREWLAYLKASSQQKNEQKNNAKNGHKHNAVSAIFGNVKDAGSHTSLSAGSHIFFDAQLLVLPVRSNKKPFFRATSRRLIKEWLNNVKLYISEQKKEQLQDRIKFLLDREVKKGTPLVFNQRDQQPAGIRLEQWKAQSVPVNNTDEAEDILGPNIALMHNDDLDELCSELPVLARNNIKNGSSQNLWYEEVVPRQSLFYSFVAYSNGEQYTLWNELKKEITDDNLLLQVGGNATVGYGLCELTVAEELV